MEDMLIQSANMEIALWQNFGTGRTANATALLAIVVAVSVSYTHLTLPTICSV